MSNWNKFFRPHLFYLLDYVTPAEIFRVEIAKKIGMVKYLVTYHSFPNLGDICKWPVFDKLSDTTVKMTLYNYICQEFDILAPESFFQGSKSMPLFLEKILASLCLNHSFLQILIFQIGG